METKRVSLELVRRPPGILNYLSREAKSIATGAHHNGALRCRPLKTSIELPWQFALAGLPERRIRVCLPLTDQIMIDYSGSKKPHQRPGRVFSYCWGRPPQTIDFWKLHLTS